MSFISLGQNKAHLCVGLFTYCLHNNLFILKKDFYATFTVFTYYCSVPCLCSKCYVKISLQDKQIPSDNGFSVTNENKLKF